MVNVRLEGVSFRYLIAKNDVLKNISLELHSGKLTSIIGPNGAGKTTLAEIIRGFIPAYFQGDLRGKLYFDENVISINEENVAEYSKKIGFIFQNPFTQITGSTDSVFEEIAFGLENIGIAEERIIDRVSEILRLTNLSELKDRNPMDLSGGQKQRVAFASILAMDPDIYIIDEPTSQLDPASTEEIFMIISALKKMHKTILLIENKIELVAEYSDYVVAMNEGEVIAYGTPQSVFSSERIKDTDVEIPVYTKLFKEMGKTEGLPVTKKESISKLKGD
ncbi:ABC transporter ATP-binding protein [Companilactobacillus sp. RD055328]|uniref:energy-coupling factor ABC transporter ATP-binding protein n=1 Tax=Companilactobacillus sp. RD055328 TaxID=2916634 RepID=UPI001FC8E22A|nr:ABC transporter ATP-binding protein [Companilactobacillus sp. RD055328]GKQ43439.1 ABC transporter ATP-binding protein [Companilactobacillus sp. RD055328]